MVKRLEKTSCPCMTSWIQFSRSQMANDFVVTTAPGTLLDEQVVMCDLVLLSVTYYFSKVILTVM